MPWGKSLHTVPPWSTLDVCQDWLGIILGWGLYEVRSKFVGRPCARSVAKGGIPGGRNPQLYSTDLTYSTVVMGWKGVG